MKTISIKSTLLLVASGIAATACLNTDSSTSDNARNGSESERVKIELIVSTLSGGTFQGTARMLSDASIPVYATSCGSMVGGLFWAIGADGKKYYGRTADMGTTQSTIPAGAGSMYYEFEIDNSQLQKAIDLSFEKVSDQTTALRVPPAHSPCDFY